MSQTSSSIKAPQKNNNGSIDVEPKEQQQPNQKPKYVPMLQQHQPPTSNQLYQQQPAMQIQQQLQQQKYAPILHQPQIPIQQQQPQQYGPMHQQPQPTPLQQQQMPIQQVNYAPIQQQQGLHQQRMPMHQQEQVKDHQDIPIFECYPQQPVQQPKAAAVANDDANGNGSNTKAEMFNPNDSKYYCCCGCCHSKSGTKAIAYWEVLFVIGLIILSCLYGSGGESLAVGQSARYGFAALCDGIGVFFIIIALCKTNHRLLLPYFGCQIIKLIGLLGYSIYLIWYVVKQNNERSKIQAELMNGKNYADHIDNGNSSYNGEGFFQIIVTVPTIVVDLIVSIWFMYVIRKCYIYFRDLKLQSYQGAIVAQPYQQVANPIIY